MQTYHFMVNGLEIKAEYDETDIQNIFVPLLRKWSMLQKEKDTRIFIFLAAPPGCGKTTLSLFLQHLSSQIEDVVNVQAIGMDGFHYYNDYLASHTFEEDGKIVYLKERKGSYASFDKKRLLDKIIEGKIKDNLWPIYSREIHDPIEDQIILKEKIILMEGNYLLLNEDGWEDLITYCDDSIFIECDETILKERLIQRKVMGGLSIEDAMSFYEKSDSKNIKKILYHSYKANTTLEYKEGRFLIK